MSQISCIALHVRRPSRGDHWEGLLHWVMYRLPAARLVLRCEQPLCAWWHSGTRTCCSCTGWWAEGSADLGCICFHVWAAATWLLVRKGLAQDQWANLGWCSRVRAGEAQSLHHFPSSDYIVFANIPLAKASPKAETRVRAGGHLRVTWPSTQRREG